MGINADCDRCGSTFEAKSARARYCSQVCRQAAYRARTYEPRGYPVERSDLRKEHTFTNSYSAGRAAIEAITMLGTAARLLDAATTHLEACKDIAPHEAMNVGSHRFRLRESFEAVERANERVSRW